MFDRGVRSRRFSIGLCILGAWLLSAATHFYVIVPASVLGRVATDLATSEATTIWLVSAIPGTWALTNFALGGWIDRLGAVRMIELGVALVVACTLATWWTARAGSFAWLLATRLLAGVAIGVIWTASTDLIGGLVATTNRGTALGFFVTSAPVGFTIGQLTAPRVTAASDWPVNFLLVAAGAVAALVVLRVGVRDLAIEGVATTESVLANLAAVRSQPVVLYGSLLAFGAYSVYLFLNSWLPTYLSSEFAATAAMAGLLSAVFPAMGILSRTGGGLVSDRLLGQRRIPVIQAAFLVTVPLVIALAVVRSLAVIVVALVVAGFVIQLTFGVVYSYVQESVDPAVSGSALAVVTTAGMVGSFSAPIVAGLLIDFRGTFDFAFAYALVLAVLGLVASASAPESDST